MTEVPGIYVDERPPELRARIWGTGITVYEVYKVYVGADRDWDRLRGAFGWLTEEQLRAALKYAKLHEPVMAEQYEEECDLEDSSELWKRYPQLAPPHR